MSPRVHCSFEIQRSTPSVRRETAPASVARQTRSRMLPPPAQPRQTRLSVDRQMRLSVCWCGNAAPDWNWCMFHHAFTFRPSRRPVCHHHSAAQPSPARHRHVMPCTSDRCVVLRTPSREAWLLQSMRGERRREFEWQEREVRRKQQKQR